MRIVGFEDDRAIVILDDGTRMTADLVVETSDNIIKQLPYMFHLGGYLTLHNPRVVTKK